MFGVLGLCVCLMFFAVACGGMRERLESMMNRTEATDAVATTMPTQITTVPTQTTAAPTETTTAMAQFVP